LENFVLPVADRSSILLIGNNGAGKTTVALALEVLQRIARGASRVDDVLKPKDLARGRADVPMKFEIEIQLAGQTYKYSIAFEFPPGFKELRVLEESLLTEGKPVFTRELAQVHLATTNQDQEAKFLIDWHRAALPIVQERSPKDPLFIFRQWLASLVILRPIPILMKGNSEQETLRPNTDGTDFGAWFSGLIASAPAAYGKIDAYLKQLMPDIKEIRNPVIGKDARSLEVQFSNEQGNLIVPFADLSDGEKCFSICAMLLAANDATGRSSVFGMNRTVIWPSRRLGCL
jgi:predicted ATPase